MIGFHLRVWFLHIAVPIKKWASSTVSNIHLCLAFAALQGVWALAFWTPYPLDAAIVWLLAAFYAWRLHGVSEQVTFLTSVNQVQQAIVRAVLEKANLVKDAKGELRDGDMGSSSSTPGDLPSP